MTVEKAKVEKRTEKTDKRIWNKVIGHKGPMQKLLLMIEAGRMPNSLLFVGSSGHGKKLVAFGLAQALLCEKAKDACGVCSSCLRVYARQSEGVIFLEPEKEQIKIDAARAVVDQLALSTWGKARIVIIDEAHLLNPQAANALLKSIEEPPKNTHFILLSPSQESILKTLRSRSQIMRFAELSRAELSLLDQPSEDPEMRDAAFAIWRKFLSGADAEAIEMTREKMDSRERAQQATRLWLDSVRDLWFARKNLGPLIHDEFATGAPLLTESDFSYLGEALLRLRRDLSGNCDVQLALENFLRQAGRGRQMAPQHMEGEL